MAYQIILKRRFINKLKKTLWYVEEKWGKQVADQLMAQLDERLDTLANQPSIGISSEKNKRCGIIFINKTQKGLLSHKG